jgi:hypothetical protein
LEVVKRTMSNILVADPGTDLDNFIVGTMRRHCFDLLPATTGGQSRALVEVYQANTYGDSGPIHAGGGWPGRG